RMGCVVFHYDMVGYADQPGVPHRTDFNDLAAAQWLHSKMGLQTWNSLRALDFIANLPDVDPDRIAVTGASGGGTQTFILCALDPRPAVAFPAVMVGTAMQGGCNCENAHYLRVGLNNVAFAAAFAPRPQAMSGADDWTIDIETKGLPELRQVYSMYGAADMVQAKCYPQFGHNYNSVSREMMYRWMKQQLNLPEETSTEERNFTRLSADELAVFDDEHPRPADVLDAAALRESLTEEAEAAQGDLFTVDGRKKLSAAVRVMLGSVGSGAAVIDVEEAASETIDGVQTSKGIITEQTSGRSLPAIAILNEEKFAGKVLVAAFGQGKVGLFDEQGHLRPELQSLVDAGYCVLSADLYLTGEFNAGGKPFAYQVDTNDPVYTFCYNRPRLAERVQDLRLLVQSVAQREGIEQIDLLGMEGAGPWVALARTQVDVEQIGATVVDLDGFEFANITSPQDANLLPGALRYGQLPGLLTVAANSQMSVFGTQPEDWSNAQERFAAAGGKLTVHVDPLPLAELSTLLE
ncbi:MAG: acetylxylan esterase, partial [Planctomycetaceae bacterium]|nr:acetylxylan esterase [Planctomycetaceae bacterium]